MSCGHDCGYCNPHGAPIVRNGYEYKDFYVLDDGTGRDGLATFRRPVTPEVEWERVTCDQEAALVALPGPDRTGRHR